MFTGTESLTSVYPTTRAEAQQSSQTDTHQPHGGRLRHTRRARGNINTPVINSVLHSTNGAGYGICAHISKLDDAACRRKIRMGKNKERAKVSGG